MQERLKDLPELAKKLIPDFPFGCRRPTPGNGFLEAYVAIAQILDRLAKMDPPVIFAKNCSHDLSYRLQIFQSYNQGSYLRNFADHS